MYGGFVFGVAGGLIFGLIGWLILGLFPGLSLPLTSGLFGGVSAGLLLGLVGGSVGGLVGGLVPMEIEIRMIPNQGIQASIKNALKIGLVGGLVGGLTGGLVIELSVIGQLLVGLPDVPFLALVSGLFFALFFGLFFGGGAATSHYSLRLVLYFAGYVPLNYVRFLDYAAERIFLRKVGGGYIFTHRLLMEYFASLALNDS